MDSAKDIRTGTSANGHHAQPGWDQATGAGLVDATAAVLEGWLSLHDH